MEEMCDSQGIDFKKLISFGVMSILAHEHVSLSLYVFLSLSLSLYIYIYISLHLAKPWTTIDTLSII